MVASQLQPIKAKYSIFLPVKNGAEYIAAAIESILAQQLSDFVLIILENQSTDSTLSIIRGYQDPRITVIEAPSALGIYENWRRIYDLLATKTVDAEFCTVIGHDDVFYPNFLQLIDKLIGDYPGASLYQTHFNIIDENGTIWRSCKPIPFQETYRDFYLARCWRLRDSFGTGYVFRADDYTEIGGIPNLPLLLWSDDLMVMRLMRLSCKITSSEIGFAYRLHAKSTSGAVTKNKFISSIDAAEKFTKIVQSEFSELVSDTYGKAALGYLIDTQLMLLKLPFAKYVYSPAINQKLMKLESLRSESLGYLGRVSGDNFFEKIRQSRNKIYYFVRLLFFR